MLMKDKKNSHLDPVRRQRVASQRCVGDKAAAAVRARVRQEGAVVMGLVRSQVVILSEDFATEPARPLTLRNNKHRPIRTLCHSPDACWASRNRSRKHEPDRHPRPPPLRSRHRRCRRSPPVPPPPPVPFRLLLLLLV